MKLNICPFFFLSCLLFTSCVAQEKTSQFFSPLLHYQYLQETNTVVDIPVETYRMRYRSDGLEIAGFINKPKTTERLPILIFNRGGNQDFGVHKDFKYQQFLASKGYIVLSTQLRGNSYSEGKDEMGGKDVNDILQLIEIGKSLPFAIPDKIGVFGISRGGLNTYQVSRLTDDITAIAVIGAPTNPRFDFEARPKMYTEVFQPLIGGDTITHKAEYDYRSPILWAAEINEPVLILHGADDWRVSPKNARLMIKKMKALGKEIEGEIIPGGDHGLGSHRELRNEKVLAWFDKYLKS